MENLNEGKKKRGGMAYEAALREIDAQSAVVALEAKIEKLKEMAETKTNRLNMVSEDENLSELIDELISHPKHTIGEEELVDHPRAVTVAVGRRRREAVEEHR